MSSAATDTISSPTAGTFSFQPPTRAQVGGLILAPQPRQRELRATSQPCPQPGSAAGHSGDGLRMARRQGWDEGFHGDASGMVVGWGCTGDKMHQDKDGMGTGVGQGRAPAAAPVGSAQARQDHMRPRSRSSISPAAPWARWGFRSRSNHGRGSGLGALTFSVPASLRLLTVLQLSVAGAAHRVEPCRLRY